MNEQPQVRKGVQLLIDPLSGKISIDTIGGHLNQAELLGLGKYLLDFGIRSSLESLGQSQLALAESLQKTAISLQAIVPEEKESCRCKKESSSESLPLSDSQSSSRNPQEELNNSQLDSP